MPAVSSELADKIKMSVDLGGEQVKVQRFEGVETLGEGFTLTVDIIATLGEVDVLPHLGKPIGITLFEDGDKMRDFNGLLSDSEFLQQTQSGFHYRLTARPFTWFLAQNRDMAIFQDLSVPDIVTKVLANAGRQDVEQRLSRSYGPRTYTVQYRESDWHFLTRLMEEEGIYTFFEHTADKHTLILCDAPSCHKDGTPASMPYNPDVATVVSAGSGYRGGTQHNVEKLIERVSSGGENQVTLRAFDFTKPERPVEAKATAPGRHPGDAREHYDYHPTRFNETGRGGSLGGDRLASLRRQRAVYSGRSQATSLATGTKLSVTKHPLDRLNQAYLLTRTRTVSDAGAYRSGDATQDKEEHELPHVEFDAIPADTVFHLPQATPKPIVQGLETAIVSGPAGETIFTDEYGRVKVRFHWDRGDTKGENSTCWIRVAQFGNLGSLILPRVGQEVMIDFLGGDPDQPIIMGWVFNQAHMPQYGLPANKTRALWRTLRYGETGQYPNAVPLDSGAPGANEIRFEDKGGSEEVYLHAERDMNTRVRFAETHHVGQNQEHKVGYDRTRWVGHDETVKIDNNKTQVIKQDQTEELTQGNRSVTIKQGNDVLDVKLGNISIKADAGAITIEAMQSITLKVGGSTITIDPVQIKMEAVMIDSEASAISTVKAGGMTNVEAGGMTTIKGGMTLINSS